MIRAEYEEYRDIKVGVDSFGNLNYSNMSSTYRDEDGYLVKETINVEGKEKEVNAKLPVAELINRIETAISAVSGSRQKVLEFTKLAWTYSDDTGSLTDKFSAKQGMTISSKVDEHGSFVSDFADGGRELYEAYKNGSAQIGEMGAFVTDYGVHLIMLANVYEQGQLVQITKQNGNETVLKSTDEIYDLLNSTYVSNASEQKLLDYVYDMIKDELVGTNGKYFTEYRNKLVAEYKDDEKINYNHKLSYAELSKAIGV